MKKTIKYSFALLFALVVCLMCLTASASKPKPHLGEPIEIKGGNPRPRSVVSSLLCYYYNGSVYIIGDNSINSINAIVTCLDDNTQWNDFTLGNILSIETSTVPGTYLLELTLSDGSYYYGEYILE